MSNYIESRHQGNGGENDSVDSPKQRRNSDSLPSVGIPQQKGDNLYVCGLGRDFSTADLRAVFSPFGAIDSCAAVTEKTTGHCKGYGFVKFANDQDAAKAILSMNGQVALGRTLQVRLADAKANPPPPNAHRPPAMRSQAAEIVASHANQAAHPLPHPHTDDTLVMQDGRFVRVREKPSLHQYTTRALLDVSVDQSSDSLSTLLEA